MPRYRTKIKPKKHLLHVWLALAGLFLLGIALFAIFNAPPAQKATIEVKGAPRLKVDKTAIDHGQVKLGSTLVDVVHITNVGDQPLSFSRQPYVEIKQGC